MKLNILIGPLNALTPAQKEAIVQREIQTMLPVYKAIDLPVTAEGMRQAIERDAAAISVTLVDAANGEPRAWIRYARNADSLFLKSIQAGRGALALRPLLRAALPALSAEEAPRVVSVVQGGHEASLSLHRKLGFEIEKELPRATRFAIDREELIEKIVALSAPRA